jgi:hypothetical protein
MLLHGWYIDDFSFSPFSPPHTHGFGLLGRCICIPTYRGKKSMPPFTITPCPPTFCHQSNVPMPWKIFLTSCHHRHAYTMNTTGHEPFTEVSLDWLSPEVSLHPSVSPILHQISCLLFTFMLLPCLVFLADVLVIFRQVITQHCISFHLKWTANFQ